MTVALHKGVATQQHGQHCCCPVPLCVNPKEPALMLTTHQHALAVGVTHRGGDALGQLLQQRQHTTQVLACKQAQYRVSTILTGADSAAHT